jgi:protein-S-isoprenylcysteine O-methyltransferase Ste14
MPGQTFMVAVMKIAIPPDFRDSAIRWLKSTPKRTFILYPVLVVLFELVVNRGRLILSPWGIAILLWGYLQFRLVGNYRLEQGGGGPGLSGRPADRLVDDGIYRYVRNPMYLGHLIFMVGLIVTFNSWLAVVILVGNAVWFHQRVLEDERHLEARFGTDYTVYKSEVKRWIPWLF